MSKNKKKYPLRASEAAKYVNINPHPNIDMGCYAFPSKFVLFQTEDHLLLGLPCTNTLLNRKQIVSINKLIVNVNIFKYLQLLTISLSVVCIF